MDFKPFFAAITAALIAQQSQAQSQGGSYLRASGVDRVPEQPFPSSTLDSLQPASSQPNLAEETLDMIQKLYTNPFKTTSENSTIDLSIPIEGSSERFNLTIKNDPSLDGLEFTTKSAKELLINFDPHNEDPFKWVKIVTDGNSLEISVKFQEPGGNETAESRIVKFNLEDGSRFKLNFFDEDGQAIATGTAVFPENIFLSTFEGATRSPSGAPTNAPSEAPTPQITIDNVKEGLDRGTVVGLAFGITSAVGVLLAGIYKAYTHGANAAAVHTGPTVEMTPRRPSI